MKEQLDTRHETDTRDLASATAVMMADLIALADRHKQEGDNLRRLPPALADAFLRHDVYRLILPHDLGGAEVGPLAYLQLIEQLARVDGSIAWNFAIGAGSALYGGYLPLERSRSLFAEANCCIAGAYAPIGRAEIVRDGYRVSGRWGWASGVDQARWMVLGFTVASPDESQAGDARRPEVRQAMRSTSHGGHAPGAPACTPLKPVQKLSIFAAAPPAAMRFSRRSRSSARCAMFAPPAPTSCSSGAPWKMPAVLRSASIRCFRFSERLASSVSF